MKLIDGLKSYGKEQIFDRYCSLVRPFKDYDKITKTKMIDEIIRVLSNYQYILSLCTTKELKFLEKLIHNEEISRKLYGWEILTLERKCILIEGVLEVADELKPFVKEALEKVDWKESLEYDKKIEIAVGFMIMQGSFLIHPFCEIMSLFLDMSSEEVISFCDSSALFNFYIWCEEEYIPSLDANMPIFLDKRIFHFKEDFDEARMDQGILGAPNFNVEDYKNFFYYDLNINNKKVKKLYDFVYHRVYDYRTLALIISMIREDALLCENNPVELVETLEFLFPMLFNNSNEKEFIKLVKEAMQEIPSGALNGFTLKGKKEHAASEIIDDYKRKNKIETQINARLNPHDVDLFYKIYFALLEYTNNKYKVSSLEKIYKVKHLNPQELRPIIEKLWENKDLIDEFIAMNPYRFNKYELSIVEDFKRSIHGVYTIGNYTSEYAEFIGDDVIYMVKGLRANIDQIVPSEALPFIVKTTLLPFKQYIIYDGVFASLPVSLGNNIKRTVDSNLEKFERIYKI